MQPYEEEKRTWLQMKWQQQQDWMEQQEWVEQQGQFEPMFPRQLRREGSRSLVARVAQQSGMLLVGGDIEQARNAQLSLCSER